MNIQPAILVNINANGGRAERRWKKIVSAVKRKLPFLVEIIEYTPPFDTKKCLQRLIEEKNVNCIISAGGDGSMNWILNALISLRGTDLGDFYIGGIGLGSSNDFQKPITEKIEAIPIRIKTENSKLVDIGKIEFQDEQGHQKVRYFLINSSVGVTAEANLFFNNGDRILKWLKPRFTDLAIIYAALKTILTFKNFPSKLKYNAYDSVLSISNLAVLKNPNVSGSFKFDQPIQPDDGRLGLNICVGMSKWELIKTLLDLSKGKFSGKPKRISQFTEKIDLSTENLIALELDGEVCLARDIHFSILSKKINLLMN